MVTSIFTYDHPVKVSAESGDLLGAGHFVGNSRIHLSTGELRWSSNLHTSIDPLVLTSAGTLRIEFENGTVGHTRCPSSSIDARSERGATFLVRLRGEGDPPRVDPVGPLT